MLTIDDRDYEEPPAYDTLRLVDPRVQIVKVRARPVRHWFGRRGIGDIGVRGFSALKNRADKMLAEGCCFSTTISANPIPYAERIPAKRCIKIFEIPLLIESKLTKYFDIIVFVGLWQSF